MMNKNIHIFRADSPLFREKNLVFMASPGAPDVVKNHEVEGDIYDRTLKMISVLRPEVKDQEKFLKNNPYADHLVEIAKTKFDKPEDFKGYTMEWKPGNLTLRWRHPSKPVIEMNFDFHEYAAIFWNDIADKMDDLFAGKNIPPKLYNFAAQQNNPDLEKFVKKIFTGSLINKAEIDGMAAKLDALRPSLQPIAVIERKKMKAEIESKRKRGAFKKSENLPKVAPVVLPSKDSLGKNLDSVKYAKWVDDPKTRDALNPLKVQPLLEEYKINAQNWRHDSTEGIKQIYRDLEHLGIKVNTPEYTHFFWILNHAQKNQPSNPDQRKWYLNPAAHLNDLAGLGGFWPDFAKSYEHLLSLRGHLLKYNQDLIDTQTAQRNMDSEPVARKVQKALTDNWNKFSTAIRERDFATAGVYAVGFYALWKTFKHIQGTKNGGKALRLLTYGAAAYAGHLFLKNAGYDVLKMTGLRDESWDVKGTPFEYLKQLCASNPEFANDTKDLDPGFALKCAEVNLKDLQELRERSNGHGIKFIDPKEFPNIFSEYSAMPPFNMGIGEKATSSAKPTHSPKQQNYIKAGQQLYMLSLAMEAVYDNTLKVDEKQKDLFGIPYAEAVRQPTEKFSRVRHLMAGLMNYASRPSEQMKSSKEIDDAEAILKPAFRRAGAFINFERQPNDYGHMPATLMRFPVVFVKNGDSFRMYLKNDYNGTVPGSKYVEISTTGPIQQRQIESAVAAVKSRILDLIDPLQNAGGKKHVKDTLAYVGDKWTCDVTLPSASEFDVNGSVQKAIIEPRADGKGVTLEYEGTGLRISVDEEMAKQNPAALAVIPRLVNQKEFHIFQYFTDAGRLRMKDKTAGDGKFTLVIGKSGIETGITYDKKTKRFEFTNPNDEAKLLKPGSRFSEELADALRENTELTRLMKSWEDLIDRTPEEYFVHLFKAIPNWFSQMAHGHLTRGFSKKDWSGSVPKNYTKGLLQAQRDFVLYKLANSIDGKSSLSDASDQITKIFSPALRDMQQKRDDFARLNTQNYRKGQKFSEEAFSEKVMDGIMEIGTESSDYRSWYKRFVTTIFNEYGMDDFDEKKSFEARNLIKVFAYYTSAIDDASTDNTNLSISVTPLVMEDIKKVKKARKALAQGAPPVTNPTPSQLNAQIEATTGSDFGVRVVENAISVEKEIEKRDKFDLHAEYVDYVIDQIRAKMHQGSVPEPQSSFWGIDKFDKWKTNVHLSPDRFVDGRERLTMTRDHVQFDDYMRMSPEERARVDKEKLILPRSDATLVFKPKGNDNDKKLINEYLKLVNGKGQAPIIEETALTGIEEMFSKKFNKVLFELKEKYPHSYRVGKFQKLENHYKLNYLQEVKRVNDNKWTVKITYKPSSLATEAANIEKTLNRNFYRTITRGDQESLVNSRVLQIFETTVLNENNFDYYFDRDTLGKSLKVILADIKAWLFGP